MSRQRLAFLITLGVFAVLGLVYGTLLFGFPSLANLSLGGMRFTGLTGLIGGFLVIVVLGVMVGMLAGLVTLLFFYKPAPFVLGTMERLPPTRAGKVFRQVLGLGLFIAVCMAALVFMSARELPMSVRLAAMAYYLFVPTLAGVVVGLLLAGIVRLIDGPRQTAAGAAPGLQVGDA